MSKLFMSRPISPEKKPLFFITAVFLLLVASSFLSRNWKLAAVKRLDFLSDLTVPEQAPFRPAKNARRAGSTVAAFRDFRSFNGITTYEPRAPYALHRFIAALKELKAGRRRKVTIAYFGDSMIEGDLISEDLRRLLQDVFGGSGVGFVPVTSIVAPFRKTIIHSFSDNWVDKNFKNTKGDHHLFLSGHYYLPGSAATVSYEACAQPHLDRMPRAYLLYGRPEGALSVEVNGKAFQLGGKAPFNQVLVDTNCHSLAARFRGRAPIYGFSFEGDSGVYVDNFSFRGIIGTELAHLDSSLLGTISRVRSYDLIIFQYGPNLLYKPALQDFASYREPMEEVVEKFEQAFPGASTLLVSTADKSFRYGGKMATALGVEPLLETQNEVALNTRSNLWNLYRAMGGRNSMVRWVEGDTTLANKDYTHVNRPGARRIGTLLFEAIMKEYALATANRKS
ncbi:hypothetical protein V9K67_15900 [Paraflavisolibacter sp. H34]|uniref:hypothetical protein n=1 Tax=Huijunlia imazamoxiresistens TaxID=3127457 RepID=UPI003016B53E